MRIAHTLAPRIDLYFMASQGAGNPLHGAQGYNPPEHPPTCIDVFGDDADTPCYGDDPSAATLRSWGFGGANSHLTMNGYAAGNVDPLDVMRFSLV